MTPVERSGDAAVRVLAAHARGAELSRLDVELAGWVAGAARRALPALPDPVDQLHAQQAALFAARDDEAAFAFLEQHVDTDDGDRLLIHAYHLVGDRVPDRLIEVAERHRGVWFSGPMLARATDPGRLLALVDADRRREQTIATIGELYIRGFDAGQIPPEVGSRWAALNELGEQPSELGGYRDAELRMLARTDLGHGETVMLSYAWSQGYDQQDDGTEAVLVRLVRIDPERASAIVAGREDPENRVDWLAPLLRGHFLPASAEPIVDALLELSSLRSVYALARILIMGRAWSRLERALANIAADPALDVAEGVGVGVTRLREAGLDEDAERARTMVLDLLGGRGAPGEVSPRDLFEMTSGPGHPPMVPWVPDPGLP
ncbi:MAG TPA: hypothetical protein VIV58_12870 [Kofleriaceae bacterium]